MPPIFVALFVAYLHKKNLAYRTIVSTLSAISYIHRCHDLPEPNDNLLVKNSLRGIQNLGTVPDARMPVSLDLLDKLCASVQHVCTSPWTQIFFQSMYLLAFFAFIRVGEMTLSHGRIQNVLQFSNVLFEPSVKGMYITFQHYKHSTGQPHTILIRERPGEHCPVGCLRHYLAYRGTSPGPLFILPSGHPVSSALFTSTMNKCLHFIGINASLYKAHRFRIGAASHAAKNGMSDAQIRHMGRWKSDAFLSYIRLL